MLKARQEIVPRSTVEAICAHRDRALELYGATHTALCSAHETGKEALAAMRAAAPASDNRYNYHSREERDHFLAPLELPSVDEFMQRARKMVDTQVWAHIIELTDLERIMDKTAKDQFHRQLIDDPPEATANNIYATLEQFMLDTETIFRRGIAECFSQLDRRFRSHDGFKIGSRVILDRSFDENGSWSYSRNQRDSLFDIERVFLVLDGKTPKSNGGGIVWKVENERHSQSSWNARQSEHENEYFRIRCYKNGNMHIWFNRDDHVEKVNKLLAEYYGEVIPDGQVDDDGGLFTPKTTLAKRYGFFPTPEPAAETLLHEVPLYCDRDDPPLRILEPSAGTGNLARLLAKERTGGNRWHAERDPIYSYRHLVDCVEIHPERATMLRAESIYRKVINCDFLALTPDPASLYDRIVMNPPFDRERDIDHVVHALKFLKPDGFLAAIMSAGTEFRENRKAIAFRQLMADMNARWQDLPAGSFSSVGTNINTVIVRVWSDRRKFY